MKNGIYFGMNDRQYHQIERLSASGIKNMLVSLPYFWARSWMNPHKQERDGDTPAMMLGRAYHAAVFEPETLNARFVPELDWSKFENLIENDAQVCEALKDLGQTQKMKGELAHDRARRLAEISPEPLNIKALLSAQFYQDLDDRAVIGREYWEQMHRDMRRIDDNPEVKEMVVGGSSEVTILWTCQETGIDMKARIDKLKTDCFVDLKSFETRSGKHTKQAISDIVRYDRHYLSMRFYQIAIEAARGLEDVFGRTTPEDERVLGAIWSKPDNSPHMPYLFFQEKSGVPNLLLRRLRLQQLPIGMPHQEIGSKLDPASDNYDAEAHKQSMTDSFLCIKADSEIALAKQKFLQAMEVYGTDEWYPLDMIGDIGDEDFNSFWLDEPARI